MSRLSMSFELDGGDERPPLKPRDPLSRLLPSSRRKPRHPEAVRAMLTEKADRDTLAAKPNDFGYLLIFWDLNRQKSYVHVPPGKTYLEACAIRDEEFTWGEYDKVWLVKKTKKKYGFTDFLDEWSNKRSSEIRPELMPMPEEDD